MCAWIDCPDPARSNGVCNKHRLRTIRAGRRAAGIVERRNDRPRSLREPRQPIPERLDELEFLISGGAWVTDAARRCGWNLTSAEGVARKHGRTRLVEVLIRERSFEEAA